MKLLKLNIIILISCWIPLLIVNLIYLLTGNIFEYNLYLSILIIPYFFFIMLFAVNYIAELFNGR